MITVLRQRNFALLWSGGLISLSGDMVLTTALPYFIRISAQCLVCACRLRPACGARLLPIVGLMARGNS